MLFRRRRPLGPWGRLRLAIWPSSSFSRSAQYFAKRVLRLTATPHAIAAGVAAGILASWTPFLGFHILIAFAIAYPLAGNMAAAALGTVFGNPFTFPFIWAAALGAGRFILGAGHSGGAFVIDPGRLIRHFEMGQFWEPLVKPMLVGGLPLGIISGLVFYIVTYWAVQGFQARRRERLEERARKRAVRMPAEPRPASADGRKP